MGRHRLLSDEEILRRARAVFVERGYGARTREVANAVGLSWPALVLRFGGKWELFRRAVVEPACARPALPASSEATGLRELLENLRALLSEQWPMRLQYRLAATGGQLDDSETLIDRLSASLEIQARRGEVRSDLPARTLARLVVALLVGDVAQRFIGCDQPRTEAPAVIDDIVGLLRPDPGSAIGSRLAAQASAAGHVMEAQAAQCS